MFCYIHFVYTMYLYIQNDIEDNSFVEEKMLSFKNEAHKLKSIDDEKS
jgi:hypothetical protein